ncbi:heme lyase CcmF/NrfE family subunit [Methylobacillus gramineus]|uniref:heme lyase CcmF/NrfE family subunit n=1 Tax=Methylobacillus gramineus TaxID=755169 RepID=UPI001CFF86E6|nr:heme lyase CcmF/NrfE family subunit [Methylobacillus gramineus]MCB5183622.1 heme lyase CcmF/NrfE family subunit [Methylobacillus gramineus]
MIPEIGHFALILALLVAVVQGVFPIAGAALNKPAWIALAKPSARLQFLLVTLAMLCLAYTFAIKDYSVLYVASNSNSKLPLHYRVAALWGGHEGSLLLWVFILNLWTLAVSFFSKALPELTRARILGVMGLISIGFLLFMLTVSNPFERLIPAAIDGRDLNPLLQDPGMVFHPPMLYMGYVGFSVAFAFAIAALLGGELDAAWARWSRPWTTLAWLFLTVGIMAGSNWAYYELGWGGWWFWDAVENASFMPWLVGTALIHSLAVTEKRGSFKAWTVLLAITAFSLSLLGTFLVRSGVLTSVHAFATDPERGLFILAFLVIVIGGSLGLFAWRATSIAKGGSFSAFSRESLLLSNNVLLVVAAASVMLGTLYPLFLDTLNLGKISVGPPYFDTVFAPLMAPAVFLMGIGPLARWKKAELPELIVRLRWAFLVSVVTAILLPLILGRWTPMVGLGLFLAFWVFFSSLQTLWGRLRLAGLPISERLRSLTRSWWGMWLAHIGIGVFILGVTIVKGFETETAVRMHPGDVAHLSGYDFTFDGVAEVQGPNYIATQGNLRVSCNQREVASLHPQKRLYTVQNMPMTEAGIAAGLWSDQYASLGESLGDGSWSVRIYHKPMVNWIWGGCLLMAAGGVLALSDKRYRIRHKRPGQQKVATV